MKILSNTTTALRSLIAGSLAVLALAAATTAQAGDHRKHCYSGGYNPLYGNYAAYHGGRGPTSGYWGNYNYNYRRPVAVYRAPVRYYTPPRVVVQFGGSRCR